MIKEIEERLQQIGEAYKKDSKWLWRIDAGLTVNLAEEFIGHADYLLDRVKQQEAVVGAARTFIFTEDGDRAMIAYIRMKDLLNNPKEAK